RTSPAHQHGTGRQDNQATGSARIAAMNRRTLLQFIPALTFLCRTGSAAPQATKAGAPTSTAVYELRIYHTYEGKLDNLLARFREHTMRLFEKHGIKNIAYWTPTDDSFEREDSVLCDRT